jgi:hypothetical protein
MREEVMRLDRNFLPVTLASLCGLFTFDLHDHCEE